MIVKLTLLLYPTGYPLAISELRKKWGIESMNCPKQAPCLFVLLINVFYAYIRNRLQASAFKIAILFPL